MLALRLLVAAKAILIGVFAAFLSTSSDAAPAIPSQYASVQIKTMGGAATPFCLGIMNGLPVGGAGIGAYNCVDGAISQIFLLTQLTTSFYTISPQSNSHLCLDTSGGGDGSPLRLRSCTQATSQQWQTSQNPDGTYTFATYNGASVAEMQGGIARVNGTALIVGTNLGYAQAEFVISGLQPLANADLTTKKGSVSPGFPQSANVQIQTAYNSNLCADIFGGSVAAGYGADLFSCFFGDPHETFTFVQAPAGGTYQIQPKGGGGSLCLYWNGRPTANGTVVVQRPCNATRNDQWIVAANADGTFSLLSAEGQYALEVQGGASTANNTPLLAWQNEGDPQARFLLAGFLTNAPPTIGNRIINPSETLPTAFIQAPEFNYNTFVPHGKITSFTMSSSGDRYYPGTTLTGAFSRKVYVYTPAQYVSNSAAPFMVVQDGTFYVEFPGIINVFDNLIAAGEIPPMIVIFADNGGAGGGIGIMNSQDTERNLEYDTLSPVYGEWVNAELLPAVIAASGNTASFTTNPLGRGAIGGSSGGIAAFTMAWFNPNSFSKILSFSGSFTNLEYPPNRAYPMGGWSYPALLRQAAGQTSPIRAWLNAGTEDLNWSRSGPYLDWTKANVRVAQTLGEGGYHYHFDLVLHGGHGAAPAVYETLPDALRWLWGDYK